MLKLSSYFVLSAISILAWTDVASAGPTTLNARVIATSDTTASITVCNDFDLGGLCFNIPVHTGDCVNLNSGRYQVLYKEISSANIPPGIQCTFYNNLSCLSAPNADDVAMLGSAGRTPVYRTLNVVQGRYGRIDFDDETGSISCSGEA